MLIDLPQKIQEQIKTLLIKDKFIEAKRLYDQWHASRVMLSGHKNYNNSHSLHRRHINDSKSIM